MTRSLPVRRNLPFAFALLLAGCGGGGGEIVLPGLFFYQLTPSDGTVVAIEGERSGASVDYGRLSGTIDDAETEITFGDGTTVTIAPGATEFVKRYEAQFSGATQPAIGVFGQPTAIAELPAGGATYTGEADFLVTEGISSQFEASGAVTVDARFADGEVDLTFTAPGGGPITEGSETVGVLRILDAEIENSSFTGGRARLTESGLSTALPLDADTRLQAGFFGENADEVGGVLRVDGSDFVPLRIEGTFTAD